MARQSIIDRYQELMERQGGGWIHNNPCNISPVSSTVGLNNNHRQIELDITPLNKFVKNMFPFVIDTSYLKVSESTYTDGRRTLDNPQIKLIVSPAHRAELYSEDIEYKVKNHIREKLIPLLRTMYEISPGFGLEIYFGSERSETILEHLDQMTKIEKEIVKLIEEKFGYPYMTYDKAEQTWTNNYFLYDIKTETIYSSDNVKLHLSKRFGTKYIENNYFNLISKWFKMSNKYDVKHVV